MGGRLPCKGFARAAVEGAVGSEEHPRLAINATRLRFRYIGIDLNPAHDAVSPVHYLPGPLAPRWTISSAFSILSDPPTWLGGYSLNVSRKPPTSVTAGTIVHSLSPHQRAYIIDWS